jgi:hypothetical protein
MVKARKQKKKSKILLSGLFSLSIWTKIRGFSFIYMKSKGIYYSMAYPVNCRLKRDRKPRTISEAGTPIPTRVSAISSSVPLC